MRIIGTGQETQRIVDRPPESTRADSPPAAPREGGAVGRPTPATARDARAAIRNDAGSRHVQHALAERLSTRPPGAEFVPRTREQVDAVIDRANQTGDFSKLDSIDNFRQTLTPELQAEYDRQVEELRSDPRVEFEYRDGAQPDPALEELALRGIVASTFGNPALLEETLDQAVADDGRVPIYVYPGPVPIGDFHAGNTNAAAGLATPDGGIAIDQEFFKNVLAEGDNAFVHEFSHLAQRTGERFPGDFPYEEAVLREFESDEFQEFLIERFHGGDRPTDDAGNPVDQVLGGAETFPTLQNLFRQFPEELKEQSPEIYRAFTEYYGYDPLTRESGPPVQLNGTGNVEQAAETTLAHFDQITDGDTFSTDDLERLLSDPDPSIPQEVRAAAAYLLSSDVSRNFLDVGAGRDDVDGDVSREDLTGALDTIAGGSYYDELLDTAAGRGGRDGDISERDLEAARNDPGLPPLLRILLSRLA
jgi:hypothetical protein